MPCPAREAAENAAFLDALRRSGNSSLAAREVGLNRSTLRGRKRRSAVFAAQWEAATLACHAALKLGGGPRPPEGAGLRTRGGENMVGRTRGGRLQLRRSPPGRMTDSAERLFLDTLEASANFRLAADATGFGHTNFIARRRARPGFAGEIRIRISIARDRLLWDYRNRPEWIPDFDVPIPRMTVEQAIFQQKFTLEDGAFERYVRRRAPLPRPFAEVAPRIRAIFAAFSRARHFKATGSWRYAHEQPPPPLPPLHLVTGWSKADPAKVKHNPKLALFGGWRIGDLERRRKAGRS